MAVKTLSNGKLARPAKSKDIFARAAPEWARSALQDPPGRFIALMVPAPLIFLRGDEQLRCRALIATAPALAAGAEAERFARKIGFALREAEREGRRGDPSLSRCMEELIPGDGAALAELILMPAYTLDPARPFWDERLDPRKARRARRLGQPPKKEQDDEDEVAEDLDWDALFHSVARALARRGFAVELAPWIVQDWTGLLHERSHREGVRARCESGQLQAHLSPAAEALPRPARRPL